MLHLKRVTGHCIPGCIHCPASADFSCSMLLQLLVSTRLPIPSLHTHAQLGPITSSGVESAGALAECRVSCHRRFMTSRSTHVIRMLGRNDRLLVHQSGTIQQGICIDMKWLVNAFAPSQWLCTWFCMCRFGNDSTNISNLNRCP